MLTPRTLLIASCVFLSAGALPAEAQVAATANVMAGTWTGHAVNETNRAALNVEFRVDAGGALSGRVTGPELNPGSIRGGTFDPKSGALKFEVVVDRDSSIFRFDGTVVGATATGRVRSDAQEGSFTLTKNPAGKEVPVPKPVPADDPELGAIRRAFTEVNGWVTRAADLVPADRYGYRPAPSVRTVAQLIGHIADAYVYYCGRAAGQNVQWSDAIEKGSADKATLVARLKQTSEACTAAYAAAGAGGRANRATANVGALVDNVGHTNLHYGNIVTYMRMLGLVPPSS